MSGIYIHIPFCKKACHYCDFHFSTSTQNAPNLVDCIILELEKRVDYLPHSAIQTIYFGGGTPSLLNSSLIQKILHKIQRLFQVDRNAEITLEANPDDLTLKKLTELKNIGINRLSIGIQSFIEENLTQMNRSHTVKQAINSVKEAQNVGFKNISIDLIYGLPNLSINDWEENLKTALTLNIQHISSYCLTVEPKTALAHFIKNKKIIPQEETIANQQFEILVSTLKNNGLEQYEISNFSKKNYISKHNSAYWKKENYLGVGPSAHSFNGKNRRWNISNNPRYIKSTLEGNTIFQEEILSDTDLYNEYIMTGLRTTWGINLTTISIDFGIEKYNFAKKEIEKLYREGFLHQQKEVITLTDKGKLFADKIASELFYI